jgi:hypothetical protein
VQAYQVTARTYDAELGRKTERGGSTRVSSTVGGDTFGAALIAHGGMHSDAGFEKFVDDPAGDAAAGTGDHDWLREADLILERHYDQSPSKAARLVRRSGRSRERSCL